MSNLVGTQIVGCLTHRLICFLSVVDVELLEQVAVAATSAAGVMWASLIYV